MKVYFRGRREITGARDLICDKCKAELQITKTDVHLISIQGVVTQPAKWCVQCPECGNNIEVKNEMENL
jgi:hypothetical protein